MNKKKVRIVFTKFVELYEDEIANLADYLEVDNRAEAVCSALQDELCPDSIVENATGRGIINLDMEWEEIKDA